MQVTVDVTQEDISLGVKGDANGLKGGGCMVYRAFMRATEGAFPYIHVGPMNIYVYPHKNHRGSIQHIQMPVDTFYKISAFDAGNPVEPFSFQLEVEPLCA